MVSYFANSKKVMCRLFALFLKLIQYWKWLFFLLQVGLWLFFYGAQENGPNAKKCYKRFTHLTPRWLLGIFNPKTFYFMKKKYFYYCKPNVLVEKKLSPRIF